MEAKKLSGAIAAGESNSKAARILGGVIFYGLLVCIALAAIPYGTVEPWSQALYGCLVLLLTALAGVEIALCRSWPRSSWWWLMLPLTCALGLLLLQSMPFGSAPPEALRLPITEWWAISADPYETRFAAWRLLTLMLTGALLFRYTNSPRRLRILLSLVVGIACLSALFALARSVGQTTTGFILPRLPVGEKRAGQFISRNHFAFMLEMALGLLLGMLAGKGLKKEKLPVLLGPGLLLWAVLVFSLSRGGLLAFVAQVVFVGMFYGIAQGRSQIAKATRQDWLWRGAVLVVLVIALLLGALWLGGDDLASRFQDTATELGSGSSVTPRDNTSRADMWRATWHMFRDHPLLGTGVGGYQTAIPAYHDASGRLTPRQAHNDYLEILASGGIVLFGLATWFVVLLVRQARYRLKSADFFRRAVCFGALVGLFGVAVHSLMDFGLHVTINALLFVCSCVLATADERVEEMTTEGRRHAATDNLLSVGVPSARLGAWVYAAAAAGVLLCAVSVWSLGWIGLARLLADFGRTTNGQNVTQNNAAAMALAATPKDPEVQSAQGLAFLAQRRNEEALRAFEQAVALKPRDYVLWLQLGRARDIARQEQQAIAPMQEAARLAPYYAQPGWQIGNLLFRLGQTDEGLREMRRAAASDGDLFPSFIDLAWSAKDNNAAAMVAAVQPNNPAEHFILANYLLAKKQLPEAVTQMHAVTTLNDAQRRQLSGNLINAGAYREAYEVWTGRPPNSDPFINGGFEEDVKAGETYFGWLWENSTAGVSFARDSNQPHTGQYSFRISYKNQTEAGQGILRQTLPVEAKTHYRLSFAARTADIKTGGNPQLTLTDLNEPGRALATPITIQAAGGWQNYSFAFTTGAATSGITIYLVREKCPTLACPIFGNLWLDSFTLKKN